MPAILPIEWMEFLRSMEQLGIIEQMSRVRRSCKEIYDLARVTGRAVHNPLEGLNRFLQSKPTENYAHVTTKELPTLLRAISAYPHAHVLRLGLRLLMLTGVRPSELREARWDEFDRKAGLWVIPAERMKKRRPHTVPLSRQVLDALEQLHRMTGIYPLLFPGRNDRTKPRSNMAFSMALRRMGYAGQQTGHGFRHIASTTLREHGFAKEHVEAQLSHVENGVAGVYNKAIYLEQRRTMMQWYADHLDELERGNVVEFKLGQNRLFQQHRSGVDGRFKEYFAEALGKLDEHVADQLVAIDDEALVLLPQGQLMMRSVAMAFDAYIGEAQKGSFSRTV